jgi:hypothetical protein
MTDEATAVRSCPWCSAPATDAATSCGSCGAALAQRESLGDVAIPGLTSVDPALLAADSRPMHLSGPSPSQGVASGAVAAAMIGGPIGAVALGGVAAVVAAEYLGARRPGIGAPEDLAALGQPSAIALQALEQLEGRGGRAAAGPAPEPAGDERAAADPWRDLPGDAARGAAGQ